MTPEEQQSFREQWRRTAIALDQAHREELASLTDALLSMVVHYPRQSDTSGLVEQRAWFHGRRRK
jgi:hypothetical protein